MSLSRSDCSLKEDRVVICGRRGLQPDDFCSIKTKHDTYPELSN